MERDQSGIELRRDPSALAPERLLVFEVRGSIQTFVNATRKVPGLELIDEEELTGDEQDKAPAVYLLVPDAQALNNILSLWHRWTQHENLGHGFTPWRDMFATLRDIRPWGPQDRVQAEDQKIIAEEIASKADDERIRLEIELVFRSTEVRANETEVELSSAISAARGRVLSRCRITDIGYHAILAELTVATARSIIERSQTSIAGLDPVMHIRPQSIATTIEVSDAEDTVPAEPLVVDRPPILALLDGVPVAQHPLLAGALVVEDKFGLEPLTQVANRYHGTSMASLIMHGDLNKKEQRLGRRIHLVPVLGPNDEFPDDRLVVDLIYQAVLAMRDGGEPSAPEVVIVNISLGSSRKPFHGRMSAWAKLIDRLSYRFGILFVISAGNHPDPFDMPGFSSYSKYEDSADAQRAHGSMSALGLLIAERRLLSPSESVNGVAVGASNVDAVSPADRRTARNVDPFPNFTISNPSSALGPGFSNSVKPDILMPGAKEHLRFVASGVTLSVKPSGPARAHGLKVAAPPRDGRESVEGFTNGTSAAAALASRTCHQIHDALEAAYGDAFRSLSHAQRATLLKAILVHTASWPETASDLIKQILGPSDNRQHVRQKDNIRRFLGYGLADPDAAVACAEDRVTFWASGTLPPDQAIMVRVPIPICMNGQAKPHALQATLAWFTPVLPARQTYRAVRLALIESDELSSLRVDTTKVAQPDKNQSNRGTVCSRRWEGTRAPVIGKDQVVTLTVQRQPDQGTAIDESIPFALAVTLAMPGVTQIYDEVRARLAVAPRIGVQ